MATQTQNPANTEYLLDKLHEIAQRTENADDSVTLLDCWQRMEVMLHSDVPSTSETVLMEPVGGWVVHDVTQRCPTTEPHYMQECGEFDPPRIVPQPERNDRERRWMLWSRVLQALDRGVSIFAILADPNMSFRFDDLSDAGAKR